MTDTESGLVTRADGRIALLVALGATLLHAALTLALFPAPLQFAKYPRAAEQLLGGTLPPERIVDFSPFYLYLHVVQEALLPGEVVVFVQLVVVGAACGLLYRLLRRSFRRWVSLAGTAAFALNRGVMVYTAVLEPEIFLILFLILFLGFFLRRTGNAPVLAGISLALALSVRPSVLPLVALVPVALFLTHGSRGWVKPAAWVLAPSLALLLALAVRNGVQMGDPSPLGMNPGFVFFEGNNPLSSGRSSVYPPVVGELKGEILGHPDNPHLTYRLIASRASGRDLSTAEANRYWRSKALAFLTDHPRQWASLLATKALATVQEHRLHDLIPAERYDRRLREAGVPAFPPSLVMGAALLGAALSLRRWRAWLMVYALVASQGLLMLLMYVSERQRLAALPALVFLGCAALAQVAAARPRAKVLWGATVAGLAVLLSLPTDRTRDDRHTWIALEVSDRARELAIQLRDDPTADARQAAAIAFATAPWMRDYARPAGLDFGPEGFAGWALAALGPLQENPSRRFDRAQILLAAGELDAAEALLQQLVEEGRRFDRGFYQPSDPRFHLARIRAERGDPGAAVRLLEEALDDSPGDPFVLAELAALTGERTHHETIARYFGEIDADFLVGRAELEHGKAGAAEHLEDVARRLPELWRARIYLAAALGMEGRTEEAAELFYRESTLGRPDPVLLEGRILPLFERAASAGDPWATYRYGLVLAQYGRFDEALEQLRAAELAEPAPEIRAAVEAVSEMRERRPSGPPP